MIFFPATFPEVIEMILNLEVVPESEWIEKEWRDQAREVNLRAFFSANVESARFLDRAKSLIFDTVADKVETVTGPDGVDRIALAGVNRATFVDRMREFMIAEGMVAGEEEFFEADPKDITDIRSSSRLQLIYDTNMRQAYGFGNWKQGQVPAILEEFPAQRFIRTRQRREPRPRHAESEGEVRLKSDEAYWANYQNAEEIGGFEVPWPPFGFRSGMGVVDVSRREAQALGLNVEDIDPNTGRGLNDNLSASVKTMDPDLKATLLKELQGKLDQEREDRARITEEDNRIRLEEINKRLGRS